MKKILLISLCTACFTLGSTALCSTLPSAEPVAAVHTAVIPADWRTAMQSDWKKISKFGKIEPGEEGMKLITSEQPPEIYGLQTRVLNSAPVKQGDTLMLRFAARSLLPDKNTGVTKMKVVFSKGSPPWSSSLVREIGLSAEWERFDLPFTSKNDFLPGEAMTAFSFGYPAQILEIADLQVLDFGHDVAVASLPRTKRFADKFTPATLKKELDRIAAMRKELDAVKDPSPANGKILHVATTGNATGDGSEASPFASINHALAIVRPGDTIQVAAGEYREPRGFGVNTSGRSDAWIHITAAPGTRPKLITSNWSGFDLRQGICYIEIRGFELEWVSDAKLIADNKGKLIHGVGIAPMYASHHIRAIDNVIHGYGTGGICSLDCDYLYLEGNIIYNTAKTSPYGGSGISLCRSFNSDDYPGYHNVVRRNICFDNELLVSVLESSGGNGKALTDGNGIIIDVFKRSRKNPLKPHGEDRDGPLEPYLHRTLVENNLIYDNGGRGVHIFRSNLVDVLNNTCYLNQKSADINAGEFTAIESDSVVIANNIAQGRKGKRANTQDGSTRVIWSHNLFYGTDDVLQHDGLIETDPHFVAPALDAKPDGFRLQADSPARGLGLAGGAAPTKDLSGAPRPKDGPIDLGAYQFQH